MARRRRRAPDDVNAPRPFRIGVADRLRLRSKGREDGRRGIPDLTISELPVTTGTRERLAAELDDAVHGLWIRHLESSELLRRDQVSFGTRIPALREALAAAERALAAVERNGPDLDDPERKPGEETTAVELVRERRRREHLRAITAAQAKVSAARGAVESAVVAADVIAEELGKRRELAATRARRSRATFKRRRAVYDRALVGRHPHGAMVGELLDGSLPPLPPWAEPGEDS